MKVINVPRCQVGLCRESTAVRASREGVRREVGCSVRRRRRFPLLQLQRPAHLRVEKVWRRILFENGSSRRGVCPLYATSSTSGGEEQDADAMSNSDAKRIDEERLRIMRELVERDTKDSTIMKQLADEFVALTTPPPPTPVSTPTQLNTIEQAALLEDLFNRNYRQELEDVASSNYDEKQMIMKKKREEFEKKKGKLLEAIQVELFCFRNQS